MPICTIIHLHLCNNVHQNYALEGLGGGGGLHQRRLDIKNQILELVKESLLVVVL